jgi:hypothetical protein
MMSKIMIECNNPNDLKELEAAVEQAAGKCNITHYNQHQAMVDAGKSTSQRDSARKIAAETGESPAAVESRIRRGKDQVRQVDAPRPKDPSDHTVDLPDEAIKHDDDSKNVFHLKQYWRKANKKDRSSFKRWIGFSEFSAYDQEGMRVTCSHCKRIHVIPWAEVEKALQQRESKNKESKEVIGVK